VPSLWNTTARAVSEWRGQLFVHVPPVATYIPEGLSAKRCDYL